MGLLPERHGCGEKSLTRRSKFQAAAAPVGGVGEDGDQATPLERFERGGERGAIHGEEGGHGCHTRRLGAIERHQKRKLAIGQAMGAQHFIETASEGARRPLHVKT